MDRFLGLTEEEMVENARLWKEENDENVSAGTPNMRSVGVTKGGIDTDIANFEAPDVETGDETVDTPDAPADETGVDSPIPGTPPES